MTNEELRILAQKVSDNLIGSCTSLEEQIAYLGYDENDLPIEFNYHLDDLCFLCAQCEWWCEAGDYADKQDNPSGDICSDCGE